jgi:hypothetical protein
MKRTVCILLASLLALALIGFAALEALVLLGCRD